MSNAVKLAPAETLQPVDDTPVITLRFGRAISVIRAIPAREIAGWFAVFGLLAVVAAGLAVFA